jgi:hypothetical protein
VQPRSRGLDALGLDATILDCDEHDITTPRLAGGQRIRIARLGEQRFVSRLVVVPEKGVQQPRLTNLVTRKWSVSALAGRSKENDASSEPRNSPMFTSPRSTRKPLRNPAFSHELKLVITNALMS